MITAAAPGFEQRMLQIEDLVGRIERSSDPVARDAAREMVRALLDLHAAGLAKMLEPMSGDGGRAVLDAWLADDLVRSLFLLHDLHPDRLEDRVEQALEGVRPYLKSHGGDVELIAVSDNGVRLRMRGNCDGCPSSAETFRSAIEQAVRQAAPDVTDIEVEGLKKSAPSGLVQLELTAGRT